MPDSQTPQQNHLLAVISDLDHARITPQLQLVPMPLGKALYESGEVLRHVYSPIECVVGIALFVGGETTPNRAVVQSAGQAYRLCGQRLKEEFNRSSEIQHLLLRYTQSLITQMAQMAVCNRHHSVGQQLCRWLLLSLDRLSDNKLTMTQELIADMLGVRREGVTEAAGRLQKAGVIKCSRGHITLLDRPKLEEMCCECYAVTSASTATSALPLMVSAQFTSSSWVVAVASQGF